MAELEMGSKMHEQAIGQILSSGCDMSILYTHPKLMGNYFWKDDMNKTRKQRTDQIKEFMSTNIKPKKRVLESIQSKR